MRMKEDILFCLYRNKKMKAPEFKGEIYKKFGISDCTDLYIRIVNYQIEKYGYQLIDGPYEDEIDATNKINKANRRRHAKKRYYKDRRFK